MKEKPKSRKSKPRSFSSQPLSQRAEETAGEGLSTIPEISEFNRLILETSPIGILTYQESGRCLFANEAAAKVAGTNKPELLAQNFHQIPAWKGSGIYEAALEALRTDKEQELETSVHTPSYGKNIWLCFRFSTFFSKGERLLLVFTSDISERKRAEQELQESREHHQSLMESATNFVVYRLVHDQDNPHLLKVVFVSPSIQEILGLSDPLRFESWFETMHPDDVERVIAANIRAFKTHKFNEAYRFFHPLNNEWRWIQAISNGVFDEKKGTRFVNGILLDITDKKKAEESLREAYDTLEQKIRERTSELQISNEKLHRQIEERKQIEEHLRKSEARLKFLAKRLINAQENERKRIAFELHDELGQSLVALKFQLSTLQKKSAGGEIDFSVKMDQALEAINGMTENVRRLSRELRPSVLEHMGLWEALQWLFEDFRRNYQIKVINSIKEIKMKFSKEQEIIIFRIFQESLFNIWKHARATQVTIAMTDDGLSTVFSIKDNGKGFNLKEVKGRDPLTTGLGLIAMKERALMAGGIVEIKSEKGKGTKIFFSIQGRRTRRK